MKFQRKPDWLKTKIEGGEKYKVVKNIVEKNNLNTICSSGKCPNIGECWSKGTATLMILGDICTRSCKFCATQTGNPLAPEKKEPKKLAEAVKLLNLKHVVITSVNRDDLKDFGANHWAKTIEEVRKLNPKTIIEVLVPDFNNEPEFLDILAIANPDIMSHNVETIERLTPQIRNKANYKNSLSVLNYFSNKGLLTKSGLMLGLGEKTDEVKKTIKDIYNSGCKILTIGQYLQPTKNHLSVIEYIHPDLFNEYKKFALSLGFSQVESAPLVRSSYMAEKSFSVMCDNIKNKSQIIKNISLKNYNTFKIDSTAEYFSEINSKNQLQDLFANKLPEKKFIIGGGSNLLFKDIFDGIIIKINNKGINFSEENDKIIITVSAGENWDELVEYCCNNNWYGLENLSAIPGTVGASVVQNIGAFGVEVAKTVQKVEVYDTSNNTFLFVNASDCKFGYRDSRFKNEWKNKFIVTSVEFILDKNPKYNLNYSPLKDIFNEKTNIFSTDIRKKIIEIRNEKLPDINKIGSAGSFFKNVYISKEKLEKLLLKFPEIVFFKEEKNKIKLATAWLIEKTGWKGKRIGDAGVHKNQALVLVNYGNANSKEIIELSEKIKESVYNTFEVIIENEVIIIE